MSLLTAITGISLCAEIHIQLEEICLKWGCLSFLLRWNRSYIAGVPCQAAWRLRTLWVVGHCLCPHVIYYPSQWPHSCLEWPFHRALQSFCVHRTSPSPVPAPPHPVCFLISTQSLDLSKAQFNISVPKCNRWEITKHLPAIRLLFYNHQPSGQMPHPHGSASTITEKGKITGTMLFYYASVHKRDKLSA